MRYILIPLVLCTCLSACAPTVVLQDERDAVRAAWDASVTAALMGNFDGWADVFSEDVEIISPDASLRLVGWDDVEKIYRPVLERATFTAIETNRFDMQIAPSGDFAWGTVEAEVTANGTKSLIWYGLVYRKEAGDWKMVLGYDAIAK